MTRLYVRRSAAWKELSGMPVQGSSAPDAPQNLQLTPSDGAIIVAWDAPLSDHGSSVSQYVIVVSGGPGGNTFDLPASQRSLSVSGLQNNLPYTVSVTAANALGSSSPASATATPVNNAAFDPRTYDYATLTGPQLSITQSLTGRVVLSYVGAGNLHGLSQAKVDSADGSWVDVFDNGDITISDCELNCPINWEAGDGQAHALIAKNLLVKPTLQNQHNRGARTGAVGLLHGTIQDSQIQLIADGIQGFGGLRTVRRQISRCWIRASVNTNGSIRNYFDGLTYGGGAPGTSNATTGKTMTEAQTDAVNSGAGYQPGKVVNTGDFVTVAPQGGASTCFQVIQGGTLETSAVPTTWPTTEYAKLALGNTTQPFASGTAQLICVGPHFHSDGIQWSAGTGTSIDGCRIDNASNSEFIIQSSNASQSNANPVWSVWITNTLMSAGINFWMYIQGQGQSLLDSSQAGGYERDSSGNWTVRSKQGNLRPWAVMVKDCWFGPKFDGITQPATDLSNVISGTKSFVPDVATWQAKVAAQYPGITQAQLDGLWDGTLDLTTLPPVDTAVLEQRYQSGLNVGGCDARGLVVWSNNRRTVDEVLLLSPNHGVNFDSQGYYIGI